MTALRNTTSRKQNLPPSTEAQALPNLITRASDVLAPVWPLKTFIACNPLQGLESLPFEQAISRALACADRGDAQAAVINQELIKWLGAFLDEGQATISMPGRERGFYAAFRELAPFDRNLSRNPSTRAWINTLPPTPQEAIAASFQRLKIAPADQEELVRAGFAALPGWSGYVKWRTEWQSEASGTANPITLTELVAVRLALTCVLAPEAATARSARFLPPHQLGAIESGESAYRAELLGQLRAQTGKVGIAQPRSEAQLVFCIDVRSEPFRRCIEAQGAYETFGFAGFFGLPVQVKDFDEDEAHDSCPVLLKACHTVCEEPLTPAPGRAIRRTLWKLPQALYQRLKYNVATPFALVEMLGPWSGLRLLQRTFAPKAADKPGRAALEKLLPTVATAPDRSGIPLSQQAHYGEGALRAMGLTENFAPLVVLCGHGSTTTNNAYAAALDCGACGGNHGGPNSRLLAAILNDRAVRTELAQRGLAIPDDTLFLAAEHNTTTDDVLFREPAVGISHTQALARLQRALVAAGSANQQARCRTFGLKTSERSQAVGAVQQRASDWSEVRPEWGLARNAAFIVAPRALTRQLDLGGRSFLHSYDWQADSEGSILQTILTAPMVVGQWINNQYLFSTLDNVAWGGGSKVTQNVTGKLGVMQGNASDLMHGLPLQSVYASDTTPYHEPLRLLTVVYAPRQRVQELIERNLVLQKLFFNGWVNLAVLDPTDDRAYLLQRDSTWQALS